MQRGAPTQILGVMPPNAPITPLCNSCKCNKRETQSLQCKLNGHRQNMLGDDDVKVYTEAFTKQSNSVSDRVQFSSLLYVIELPFICCSA